MLSSTSAGRTRGTTRAACRWIRRAHQAGGQQPIRNEDGSAAIILLSDGQTTTGPNPIEAARMAADRGVRIYTVGIGTPNGEILGSEGWSMRVRLDEESLKTIANVTHGEYFYASNAKDLKKVYESLNTRLALETRQTEITALLAAAAAVITLLAAFLSMLWFNRVL